MKFAILEKWVRENFSQNLIFLEIKKFEDQFAIFFLKQNKFLQINLHQQDCFCFFTDNDILPFQERPLLNNFNEHLCKSKFEKITIFENDRIIALHFSRIDIYNQKLSYQLILELIPNYANIILTQKGKILEALRKFSLADNPQRQILPGIDYQQPKTNFTPVQSKVLYPISFTIKSKLFSFSKTNTYLEAIYYQKLFLERNHHLREIKLNQISRLKKKKEKKLKKLQTEFQDASREQKWKKFAELLKGNFSKLQKGMKKIKLKDYYVEGFPEIEIPLQPKKYPQENLEFYYKKARKAKSGKKKIAHQIFLTKKEIAQLEKEKATIRHQRFFLSSAENSKKKEKEEIFQKIRLDNNWEIVVGRNSQENDRITLHLAKPHDWWFHTRIFKGTHVLLRNLNKNELPERLKLFCARIAAYYSKAKKSTNVPVDFTQIRYVRKPRKSPPGFVVYENQQTIFVDPLSYRQAKEIVQKGWKI